MKWKLLTPALWAAFLLMGALFITSCNKDDDPTDEEKQIEKIIDETPVDPYTIAKKLVDLAGWPEEEELDLDLGNIELLNYKREVIFGDIVHYSVEVAVGTHQYDKIRIHRLVKEATAGKPLLTEKNLFYQHGDAKTFVGMLIPSYYSPSMPDGFGMGVYLAENGIDVWGVDQAWCFVPADATDFSYFQNYGIEKAARDMRNAMAVARIARYLTGNAFGKMNLAGYSSAVPTGYAACDLETQLDPAQQHIKGYIPIDFLVASDEDSMNLVWDEQLVISQVPYDAGQYELYVGFTLVGSLARNDPGGASPVIPGFTNLEVAQFFSSGTVFTHIPFHYWAAEYVSGFPGGDLKYITREQTYDFMESAIEYQPQLFFIDYCKLAGNSHDSPFDDHIAQVKVPILNLSAGGGCGESTKYWVGLTGSTDVTHVIPSVESPDNILEDFGHIDIFTATNAETLAWQPLLNWLNAH